MKKRKAKQAPKTAPVYPGAPTPAMPGPMAKPSKPKKRR